MNSISVQSVSVTLGSTKVIDDVSFDVAEGDYIGLVGQNGAGKTTLIKAIVGILPCSKGTIELFGTKVEDFASWKDIGYMPQMGGSDKMLFPATVEEIIALGLISGARFPKNLTKDNRHDVEIAMQSLGISSLRKKLLSELSGGQKQRVLLAKAMVNNPKLLILDEPNSAIDTKTREQLFDVLQTMNEKKKTTIIVITHDIGHIGRYASKLLYIDRKLIFYGSFKNFCESKSMTKEFGGETQHLMCHQHE